MQATQQQASAKSADATLMLSVASGDESAFAQLLDSHINLVHHFVLRTTNKPNDADDIVQETFLRAWRNARNFSQTKASVKTWLISIARNLCIDQHRRSNARPTGHSMADGQPTIDALEDNRPDDTQQLDKARRLQHLREAIAELPERQRTAITLCQLQGYSNADAAEILQINIAAVESLLARARRALRATLTTIDPVKSA